MKYFTSDLHFNHKNLCRGVSQWEDKSRTRKFYNLEAMNAAILGSINFVVRPDDELFILGDFAFGDKSLIPELRNKINCESVHILYGNHDHAIREKYYNCFSSAKDYDEIRIKDKTGKKHTTILFHYYIGGVWNKAQKGAFHCYAHSHGGMRGKTVGRAIDVGWDVWHRPLSEIELSEKFLEIPIHKSVDHHTKETSYY